MKDGCDNRKNRNLFLLCLTKFLSGFAGYIYDIGIVIYLFQKTESVAVIGGFFVSQFLPAFIILMTGGIIDRYNKKFLMIFSNAVKAVLMLILLLNQEIWCIYIVTFLMNLILEFESSTVSALMVHVFAKEKLFKAASVVNFLDSFSMIAAPLCASAIALYFQVNMNLVINSVLFIATAFFYVLLKVRSVKREKEQPKKIAGGYREIIGNRRILKNVVFWNIFMFCIGLASPLEISMIEETLKMPSHWYGIGNAVEGVGMLTASFFILHKMKKMCPSSIISAGLFSAAFSYVVIGISGNIGMYFIGACLVGVTSTFCPLGFKTEMQIESQPEVIGRTFAASRFMILVFRMAGSLMVGQILKICNIRIVYIGIAALLFGTAFLYRSYMENRKS